MLTLVASPIGRDCVIFLLILLIIGAIYGYWRWSQSQIATLTANVATVQAQANDQALARAALAAQIAQIAADQRNANQSITQAQVAATQAQATLRAAQTKFAAQARANPTALAAQINQAQMRQWQDLMAISQ